MIHIRLTPPTDDMIERNSVNITLHDVDPTALHSLVEYTYTGEITITEDNVQVSDNAVILFDTPLIIAPIKCCK